MATFTASCGAPRLPDTRSKAATSTPTLWPLEWAPNSIFAEPSGDACDHYHRYDEDIAILAGLERGVTPVVTCSHWTAPRWFAGAGGWSNDTAPEHFARYVERTTEHLGDLFSWVATFNEPNLMALGMHTGAIPMGAGDLELAANGSSTTVGTLGGVGGFDPARYRMGFFGGDVERMASAHRLAVDAIKSGSDGAKVGWTLALVGVQTYSRHLIGPDGPLPPPEGVPLMQTGWEIYPEALGHTVRLAAERSGVPVFVTENGMATDDDDARIAYTAAALAGVADCIADGVDVRGYLHWTLLDNFEWMAGYQMTFGLVAVDRETFARTVKPSARWLGKIARANQLG